MSMGMPVRVAILYLAGAALAAGCTTDPNRDNTSESNGDPPTHRVSSEYIDGDAAGRSSHFGLVEVGGAWFTFGVHDGESVVSGLNADGSSRWRREPGYSVRDLQGFSTPWDTIPTALVAVGGRDQDSDGRHDVGMMSVCTADGAPVSELVFTLPERFVSLAGAALTGTGPDAYELVVVGSAGRATLAEPFEPFAARVVLRSDGSLEPAAARTYPELSWTAFAGVACDASAGPAAIYAAGNAWAEADSVFANGLAVRLSESLDVAWRTDLVVAAGLRTSARDVHWGGGSVLVVGSTQAYKDPPPSGGCCWRSGLIASLSPAGQTQWLQAVSLTAHEELLEDCAVVGSDVYAVGTAAAFVRLASNRNFGYGWLTQLDLATGAVRSNRTFGDPLHQSWFNSLVVRGQRAYCVGFTHEEFVNGSFQSWFAEVDLATPTFERPAAPAAGPDAAPGGPAASARRGSGARPVR